MLQNHVRLTDAISAGNFAVGTIPYEEVEVVAVELIEIERAASSLACRAKRDLTKTPYLADNLRQFVSAANVHCVVSLFMQQRGRRQRENLLEHSHRVRCGNDFCLLRGLRDGLMEWNQKRQRWRGLAPTGEDVCLPANVFDSFCIGRQGL